MIGDHIRTLKAGRWIHAIDCGDETVILLAGDAAQPQRVRRGYRPEFVAGADAVEVVTHRERTFPAEEVVARAYSRVSDPALASMFRDSEAFAEWCTTGRIPITPPNVAVSVPGAARAAPPRGDPTKPAGRAAPRRKKKATAKAKPAPAAKRARSPKARKATPARKAGKAPARRKAAKRGARRGRR